MDASNPNPNANPKVEDAAPPASTTTTAAAPPPPSSTVPAPKEPQTSTTTATATATPATTTATPNNDSPAAPASDPASDPAPAAHKPSQSIDTTGVTSPPFSPSSTTPVLEKDEPELDFAGNVDVNDDIPTEKDLKRVGDLLVLDSKGQSRPFKELYTSEGVAPRQLIIFIRHFFCGNCQEYLRSLSASINPEDLLALPTPTFITVIGCGRPELIDMYVKETSCQFPVYADPTRRLYDILGMTRTFVMGKKPEYINSNIFVTSVQSIVQSLKTGNRALQGGDFKQVGGEFLFEGGKCTWAHRMRNTRDHLEVQGVRDLLGMEMKKTPVRKTWSHGIKAEKRERSSSWGRVRAVSRSKGGKDKEGKEKGSLEGTPRESEEARRVKV